MRRYDTRERPRVGSPGAADAATVVDGSAEGLLGLAAIGDLPGGRRSSTPATATPASCARRPGGGRGRGHRLQPPPRLPLLPARAVHRLRASRRRRAAVRRGLLNPFPGLGTAAQTVAEYEGARRLDAPYSPNFPQFPEHRPYAAFDGDPSTYWVADRYLERSRRWLEIEFEHPRDVPWVELLPQRETATEVAEVEVAGRRYAVDPGVNRLELDLEDVGSCGCA